MEEATGARDPDAAPWPTTSARVRHQLAAMRLAMQRPAMQRPARPPRDFLSTLPTDCLLRIRQLRADRTMWLCFSKGDMCRLVYPSDLRALGHACWRGYGRVALFF